MKLKDKVIIITGAANGIGKEIATIFASEGANIIAFDTEKNINLLKNLSDELKVKYNTKTLTAIGDVAKLVDCNELVQKSLDKFSSIDILVNNAGITKDNLILKMKEVDWDSVISVNLKGVFNCIKAVSKSMLKRKHGRIINIASLVGQIGNPGQVNYAASKGGVIAITKTCAKEFASRNILVNAISPGFIKTNMTNKLTDQQKKDILLQIPLSKFGEVTDIAKAALFLASDDSSYITGQVLSINGGMYL
ncbi:MAG: 3-oxoacyl-[acyl-carrier-protein] reductase [Endomicrobium sp.]|jgi:3-oxoacyl-[acyl-carrier protein] reductase|nr:3-oxoacyl-[acyl-carrier-protein] reductase [Endomicrobium sp.]